MIKILTLMFKYKVFVVAALLTFVLSSMVYGRITLLKSGAEIILLSRPIDPRDLFRGHYVIMNYGIHTLDSCKVDIKENLRRNQMVFVQLEEGEKGYWDAVSVSTRPLPSTKTTVILSGYSRRSYKVSTTENCPRVSVRYGLEKYFAPKKRAKALEDMRAGRSLASSAEMEILSKDLLKLREVLRLIYKERRNFQRKGKAVPEELKLKRQRVEAQSRVIRQKTRALREKGRAEVAVIVRVSKSGEGAISGLMIDGKKVYSEPL